MSEEFAERATCALRVLSLRSPPGDDLSFAASYRAITRSHEPLHSVLALAIAAAGCSPSRSRSLRAWRRRRGAPANGLTPSEAEAAARVTAGAIDAPLRFLSDDLLEGRGPGTRGDDLAIKFIAAEMEAMGLHPGAIDGGATSWFQKVPLVGIASQAPATITFVATSSPAAKVTLSLPGDMIVASGVQEPRVALDAPDIVFVGYGIVAPEYRWDDYKNVDVKGKVVLVMNNDPSTDLSLFEGKTRLWYGRWDYKYLEAAKHGAAGAIIIHTTPSASYPWQVVTSSWSAASEHFELPATPGEPRLAAEMWATEDASRKIAQLGGKDLDALRAAAEKREFVPVSLGVKTSLALTSGIRTIDSANVVGVIPGSDPVLAKEAVVYSAHHDHLGMHAPDATSGAKGSQGPGGSPVDTIYNGAVDNASGTATLLAIARAAVLSEPTKRSRVFIAVTAEEQGLLGSEWYATHPTVPAGRIAANLNIDSANVDGRTSDLGFHRVRTVLGRRRRRGHRKGAGAHRARRRLPGEGGGLPVRSVQLREGRRAGDLRSGETVVRGALRRVGATSDKRSASTTNAPVPPALRRVLEGLGPHGRRRGRAALAPRGHAHRERSGAARRGNRGTKFEAARKAAIAAAGGSVEG